MGPPVPHERARSDPEAAPLPFPLADGHADSLLWNRDLTRPQRRGRLDFPRLRQAGVRLQCFTVVTRGYPVVGGVGALAWWRRWPRLARAGPWARCRFQLDSLEALCARSDGAVRLARTAAELEAILAGDAIAAVPGVEGGEALEGRPERIGELRARGVAFLSLTHLANNALGGSSTALMGDRPLMPLGRAVLEEMKRAGMAVDLAHASRRTLWDVLGERAARPFCSHAGVASATRSRRNLEDQALRAIADRGGVVGIIFATVYLGGRTLDAVARHVERAVQVAGEDAVALGSDFDGLVPLPRGLRDVTGLPALVRALGRRLPPRTLEKVAWSNWRRFFGEVLAAGPGNGTGSGRGTGNGTGATPAWCAPGADP